MGQKLKNAIIDNKPFWVLTIAALTLLGVSFLLPPQGEISDSVLKAVAEVIGIMAVWTIVTAFNAGKDAKIKHNGTEVTIGDINEPEPPQYYPSPKTEDYE